MKWKVKEIAEARGITNARALSTATGIPPMSMYQIWNGQAKRADLATLEKLCVMLRVPLSLLLEYVPDVVEPLPGATEPTGAKAGRAASTRKKGAAHKARRAPASTR